MLKKNIVDKEPKGWRHAKVLEFSLGALFELLPFSCRHSPRVYILDFVSVDNASKSWIVESVTLDSTKLRYFQTGEVAYLANNCLQDMRIYNLSRSPNATIVLSLPLHVSIFEKDNLIKFQMAVENYVKNHPRTWAALNYFGCQHIDHNSEQATFGLSFRHRNNWGDAPLIERHRSELARFLYETSRRQSVGFFSPPPRQVMYMGGVLQDGAVQSGEYETGLFRPSNIKSCHISDDVADDNNNKNNTGRCTVMSSPLGLFSQSSTKSM